jgi:hypothetical protein
MISREILIGGGIIALTYLIEKQGGWPALPGRVQLNANSVGLNVTNSVGDKAALAYLAGLPSIAGIKITVDPNGGMTGVWNQVQAAITAQTDPNALATAFLGAYDAARGADPSNYSPFPSGALTATAGDGSFGLILSVFSPCSELTSTGVTLSDVGTAACQLVAVRDNPINALDSIEDDLFTLGVVDSSVVSPAINSLVTAMDAAGLTTLANMPTNATLAGRVSGATGAAASATADVVTGFLSKITGVADALQSPYVWAVIIAGGALIAFEVVKVSL